MLASLIETREPHAYISAIVNNHKQNNIEALLPWNFKG